MVSFSLLLLFSSFYLQPLYSYTIKDDSIRNNVNNKRDDDLWLPTVGTTWNWILNAPSKDIKRLELILNSLL